MSASPVGAVRPDSAGTDRPSQAYVAVVALLFVVGSRLLWSSPEYRQWHLLVASLLLVPVAGKVAWPVLRRTGWGGVTVAAGVLISHAAAWLGGWWNGASPLAATLAAAQGLLGVAALAVIVAVAADRRWLRPGKWLAFGVLTLLAVGSFAGYFGSIERVIPLGCYTEYFNPLRMALIWPTRWLTASSGQLMWDHTNYAAYYFGLALVLILESLGSGCGGRRWIRWLWCGLLGAGVFLTASRGGGLMVALALPLILTGRPPRFAATALGVLAVGVLCGYGGLQAKIAMLPPASQGPVPTGAAHGADYVNRMSSGRTPVYGWIWQDLAGSRGCGRGLRTAGQPVLNLTHEHSSFMATLRGGGLVGVAGHALVLAAAAWSAWGLLRRGRRWPAVLLVAALGGLMFDRSSVWALTGNYEFLSHWVAVWVPLVLVARAGDADGCVTRGR